ncbi:MAG TPA: hypothetical protein VLS89_10780 [Candidatus Nanopelagicales bacterium]|nr:hypothetical protein [Candidatus Nanopelagicales bacterium]
MSTAQEIRLGVVIEGPSDRRTVCGLVDRLMAEGIDWIGAAREYLGSFRSWVGVEEGSVCLAWKDVAQAANGRVPRRHGHFSGEPGLEDAQRAALALRLYSALPTPPLAVLLVRDSDGRPTERRKGLEQARRDGEWKFEVVIGVAHVMREAWVLAGFMPETAEEGTMLDEERRVLGFYPHQEPHQLDAKDEAARKSAKRVLTALTGGDKEREERCWTEAPLDVLSTRGAEAGLKCFLQEVQEHLLRQ